MLERIWQGIKMFWINHEQHSWLEQTLFIIFIIGVVVAIALLIIKVYKINKEIKEMNKDKRKRDKSLLKFISKKNNKTY